jgi:membrane-associated phospholipid phosphatase
MAVLWFRNRDQWIRYMRRFATVILLACTMFVLFPTAPPWMAAGGKNRSGYEFDALPPLRRPTGNGWRHIGLDGFVEAWDTGRDWANEVAAMPSLHSAYALFVVVFFWPLFRPTWVRWVLLSYPIMMAVALMYFGEHYLADALGGWAIVGASFLIWNQIERRLDQRRVSVDETDAEPTDLGGGGDAESVVPSATVGI